VWKKIIVSFVIGFILCFIIIWTINKNTGQELNADLKAAGWSLESAIRTNTELTKGIRELQSEFNKSNNIITEQQSIIIGQQSTINKQKSIIDGIFITINGEGNDIGTKIQSITDRFKFLYGFYN
jgi:hypothetical protein